MDRRRAFDLAAWGGVALIGGLQMARMRLGVLTDHGADILCPALLYVLARRRVLVPFNLLRYRPSPELAAVCVLVACFAWEFCQRYELAGTPLVITRGRFDPLDLVSYSVGAGAAYLAERLDWFRFNEVTDMAKSSTLVRGTESAI